ncbi:MAG: hypothetical protein AAFP92_15030 [Bacteroidota bacterium]
MRRFVGLMLCLMILPLVLKGQKVRSFVQTSQISPEEKLVLKVAILDGTITQAPAFPQIEGLQKGAHRQPIIARGASQQPVFYQQIYYPAQTGTVTVPAIPVGIDGQIEQTEPLIVHIISSDEKGAGQPGRLTPAALDYKLEMELDSSQVYQGGAVSLNIALWVRYRDRNNLRLPELDTNWFKERLKTAGVSLDTLSLNRVPFRASRNRRAGIVYPLFRAVIFPLDTGSISLPDISLPIYRLHFRPVGNAEKVSRARNVYWRPAFLKGQGPALQVIPLPEKRFTHAKVVGDFQLSFALSKKYYSTGETIGLEVEVEGKGNPAAVPQPDLGVPANFLFYDPKSEFTYLDTSAAPVYGRKVFKYQLVSAYPGTFSLGPVVLHFFHPEKNTYDSLLIPRIPVEVVGNPIPQLLEVNALDNFYRNAWKNSSQEVPETWPFQGWVLLFLSVLATGLVIFALTRRSPRFKPTLVDRKRPHQLRGRNNVEKLLD